MLYYIRKRYFKLQFNDLTKLTFNNKQSSLPQSVYYLVNQLM